MLQMNRSIITRRRLLMLKWLIIFTPPVTVMMGHSVLGYLLDVTVSRLAENLLVALLLLVLSYIFVETLFRVIRKLQAEALA